MSDGRWKLKNVGFVLLHVGIWNYSEKAMVHYLLWHVVQHLNMWQLSRYVRAMVTTPRMTTYVVPAVKVVLDYIAPFTKLCRCFLPGVVLELPIPVYF